MVMQAELAAVEQDQDSSLLERRRGLRIRQSRPVKIFEPATGRYFPGQTQDISSAGLRVQLPASTPLSAGRVLSIHVGVANGGQALANRRHMLPARVVWINRARNTGRGTVIVGVEFLAGVAAQVDAA